MTYHENVERAAIARVEAEDAQKRSDAAWWTLARLTAESTYDGDRPRHDQPDRVLMADWCRDVAKRSGRDFGASTGKRCKWIWRRYETEHVTCPVPWSDAWLASAYQTLDSAKESRARTAARKATPETKRAIFAELAADPVVVEEAARLGTPTSRAMTDLHRRADAVRQERRERMVAGDPIAQALQHQIATLDIEGACNRFAEDCARFARDINDIVPRAGAASEDELTWIRRGIERARTTLERLDHYVKTGRTDLDSFLADVLGGGTHGRQST